MKIESEDLKEIRTILKSNNIKFDGLIWEGSPEKIIARYQIESKGFFSPDYTKAVMIALELFCVDESARQNMQYKPDNVPAADLLSEIRRTNDIATITSSIGWVVENIGSIHPHALNLLSYILYEDKPVSIPAIILYGVGGNGKGVLMQDIARKLLKKSFKSMDSSDLTTNELYRILTTTRLRVIYEDELKEKLTPSFKRFYKTFTEEGEITIKKLYKDTIALKASRATMLIMSSNEPIEHFVSTSSMRRRTYVLHFRNTFKRDDSFDEILSSKIQFFPLILRLIHNPREIERITSETMSDETLSKKEKTALLQAALFVTSCNLPTYESFKISLMTNNDDAEDLRTRDTIDDFLEIFCVKSEESSCLCSVLWKKYLSYCEANKEKALSVSVFGRELSKRGIYKKRSSVRIPGTAKKLSAYSGVALKE